MYYKLKSTINQIFEFFEKLLNKKDLKIITKIYYGKYTLKGLKYLLKDYPKVHVDKHLNSIWNLMLYLKQKKVTFIDVGSNIGQSSFIINKSLDE